MLGNSKFEPIMQYLIKQNKEFLTLSFKEIEDILNFRLCNSARQYTAYWNISDTHILPQAIQKGGYRIVQLDLSKEFVKLQKEN